MTSKNKPLILIVDDNTRNLKFLGTLLMDNGYDVGVAQNGHKALEFIEKTIPHLILLDIMMPEMDGFEVCRKLGQNRSTAAIPIIFLTARTQNSDVVAAFEAGAVDYVTKPFNSAELLARVKTHIEINLLRGMIPICAHCKSIRDDEGVWSQVDLYFERYASIKFSNGMCLKCTDELYGDKEWYQRANDD